MSLDMLFKDLTRGVKYPGLFLLSMFTSRIWNQNIDSTIKHPNVRSMSLVGQCHCGTRVSQDCKELWGLWREFNGNLREFSELHTCSFAAVTDLCRRGSREVGTLLKRLSLPFGAVLVLQSGQSSLSRSRRIHLRFVSFLCVCRAGSH